MQMYPSPRPLHRASGKRILFGLFVLWAVPLRRGDIVSASPAVSVIVPVYNGERFLRQTLDSILAQTFHDYEIVAVDDGSSDGSRAILESYGDRVRVFTQKNLGAPSARNRARASRMLARESLNMSTKSDSAGSRSPSGSPPM